MEAPIPGVRKLLKKTGLSVDEIDLFEHNEAYAAASLAVMRELGIPHEKLNVNGGAVALGHPIGCSGARVLTTLAYAMKDRAAKRGLAGMGDGGADPGCPEAAEEDGPVRRRHRPLRAQRGVCRREPRGDARARDPAREAQRERRRGGARPPDWLQRCAGPHDLGVRDEGSSCEARPRRNG